MDLTAQIKKNLIARIKDSKDLKFLNALQTIFESNEKDLFQLNSDQQFSIENGRNDITNNNHVKNDSVLSGLKEWLEKK